MKKHLYSLLLLVLLSISGLSQTIKTYSERAVKEDLEFLKNSVEEYNPSLGYFHDKQEFLSTYDSLHQSITGTSDEFDVLAKIQLLAAATKEGHTDVGSKSQDTTVTLFNGFGDNSYKFLPVSVFSYKDKYFIDGNFSPNDSVKIGDQLIAINEKPIEYLVNYLEQFMIVDGNINSAKHTKTIDLFQAYYYWFYDRPASYQVKVKRGNKKFEFTIPALARDSMISCRNKRYGVPESGPEPSINDVYEFSVENDSVAILTLKSFNYQLMKKYKIKPKKLYKEIFNELKERDIEYMVLDLRNNSGGRKEYATEILPYIMKKDINKEMLVTTSWKGKEKITKAPKRDKNAFDGELYVFTNAYSFSNGSVIPMYAKHYGEAIIIGQETATRYEGFAAGSQQWVVLPNSKITIKIPRYFYSYNFTSPPAYPNRGVVPDYKIVYKQEDVRNKKDLELEKFYSLIK